MSEGPPLAVTVIDLVIKAVGAAGGIAAFTWGVRQGIRQWEQSLVQWNNGLDQWREGQRWKRAERFDKFVEQFEESDLLRLACTIVDWTTRKVTHNGREVTITNGDVLLALRNHQEGQGVKKFEGEQALIRDAFDAMLTFFARLKIALDTGLIDEEPARLYFAYWLDRLITMKAHPVDVADPPKDSLGAGLGGRTPAEMASVYVHGYGDIKLITALCGQFNVPLVMPGAGRPAETRPE